MFSSFSRGILKNFKLVKPVGRKFSSADKEQFIKIGDTDLCYMKVGNGPKTLLMLQGWLGSHKIDFGNQIRYLNRDKLTVISLETPGHGNTKPMVRKYNPNFLEEDADYAHEFMKAMGVPKYSVLGFCDGGISGYILAAKHPEEVEKAMSIGSVAILNKNDLELNENMRDISKWVPERGDHYIKQYGNVEILQGMLNSYCENMIEIYENGGHLAKDFLGKVKCPSLILYGEKDKATNFDRIDYFLKNIENSVLYSFKDGKHSFHKKLYDEFNEIITKFIYDEPLVYTKKN